MQVPGDSDPEQTAQHQIDFRDHAICRPASVDLPEIADAARTEAEPAFIPIIPAGPCRAACRTCGVQRQGRRAPLSGCRA